MHDNAIRLQRRKVTVQARGWRHKRNVAKCGWPRGALLARLASPTQKIGEHVRNARNVHDDVRPVSGLPEVQGQLSGYYVPAMGTDSSLEVVMDHIWELSCSGFPVSAGDVHDHIWRQGEEPNATASANSISVMR